MITPLAKLEIGYADMNTGFVVRSQSVSSGELTTVHPDWDSAEKRILKFVEGVRRDARQV